MDEELPQILNFNHKRLLPEEEKGIGEYKNFELFPQDIQRRILSENRKSSFTSKSYYNDEFLIRKYYEHNCQDMPITMKDMIYYFENLPIGISTAISYFAVSLTSVEPVKGFLRVTRNMDGTYTVSSYDIEHDPDVFEIVDNAKDIFNFIGNDGYNSIDSLDIFIPSIKIMREILGRRVRCIEYDKSRNVDYASNFISHLLKSFITHFEESPVIIKDLIRFLDKELIKKYPEYLNLVSANSFEELTPYYELFLTQELPVSLEIYPISLL